MNVEALNLYGDKQKFVASGHGADIATQRADDLDLMALTHIRSGSFVLDLACGQGGQSLRMAHAGANVLALDIENFQNVFAEYDPHPGKLHFAQFDLMNLSDINCAHLADAIVCQRAIHYFRFEHAVEIVKHMGNLLSKTGKIFLSASGISSELGNQYAGAEQPIETRFGRLHPTMAGKHGIHAEVCLYSEDDMILLAELAGLQVVDIFSSPFGNIKAVISK